MIPIKPGDPRLQGREPPAYPDAASVKASLLVGCLLCGFILVVAWVVL